ncbi:MAG TPA: transcriptional repressor LexA [Smithella sp.]|nr:repressor LexA [Smithella sp.]MDM7987546.1 transcriptional repressor LexA [Smithella sp.]HNY51679.1 transcriptional repressor LexA [Smithella sp.]HOG91621.1 transcriptional repressor LexA [Smithella sp.]HQO15045.1 transcriptional repressor LexA [Smithellaceae bacterium]
MKVKRTLQDVEKKITVFFLDNGRMPTYSEIAEIIGVRSKSVVHFWVTKLLDAGILQKDTKGFLSLTRNPRALKLAGEVCAGLPTSAEEELRGIVSFDEYLVRNPQNSFLLSVKGDSMSDAGIREKDMVIVESNREPKNGDIVLAEVDGNWTMKYFRRDGRTVTLEAANPQYAAITPRADLRIAGVITAVVRKYYK